MESNLSPAELLQFYIDTGADEAIGAERQDRTIILKNIETPVSALPVSFPVTAASSAREQAAPAGTFESLGPAREAAQAARTLEELKFALESFDGLSLKRTATQMVFADGVPSARIMLVGEVPGTEEDRLGRPFVGAGGVLFDKMMAAIGLSRETNIYISTIINWRPPGNRSPAEAEIALSLPFIQRHIALVNPAVLIYVGGVSAKTLLQTNQGITRLRGKWLDYQPEGAEKPIPSMAIFHPDYLLHAPAQKALAWQDLLKIKARLNELSICN